MADVLTKKQRSYNMSRIRSHDTGPEVKAKDLLEKYGFEYHAKGIYGHPDFANKKLKIVIFIDGCFWHMCPIHFKVPATRTEFWIKKIEKNVERDRHINEKLESDGWKVVRIWEHDVKGNLSELSNKVMASFKSD